MEAAKAVESMVEAKAVAKRAEAATAVGRVAERVQAQQESGPYEARHSSRLHLRLALGFDLHPRMAKGQCRSFQLRVVDRWRKKMHLRNRTGLLLAIATRHTSGRCPHRSCTQSPTVAGQSFLPGCTALQRMRLQPVLPTWTARHSLALDSCGQFAFGCRRIGSRCRRTLTMEIDTLEYDAMRLHCSQARRRPRQRNQHCER